MKHILLPFSTIWSFINSTRMVANYGGPNGAAKAANLRAPRLWIRKETSWLPEMWGGPLKDSTQGLALSGDFVYLVGSTENNSRGMNDALLIKADARTGQFPRP